jgi:hypothetical protein
MSKDFSINVWFFKRASRCSLRNNSFLINSCGMDNWFISVVFFDRFWNDTGFLWRIHSSSLLMCTTKDICISINWYFLSYIFPSVLSLYSFEFIFHVFILFIVNYFLRIKSHWENNFQLINFLFTLIYKYFRKYVSVLHFLRSFDRKGEYKK